MKSIFKTLYDLIPLKKQLFVLIRIFTNLPESIYKHLHFKGVFAVKIDSKNKFKMYHLGFVEENMLFWGGIENGWEKTSINLWKKLCIDSITVLDIGANTGIYSLITKTLNPNSKIYAFEPLPKVLEYLTYNIQINNFDISVIPKAVSNYSGEAIVFLREEDDFSYSVTVNKSLFADVTAQKKLGIETLTLSEFINENNIHRIDLIKIDVETHEPEVLEGMGVYLDKFKPDFLLEVLNQNCAEKLNILFKDKGYLYFDIDDKNGVVTQKTEISKSSYWNYLVCKPESAKKIGLI